MRREGYGKVYNCLFRCLFDTVLQVRFFAADIKQRLDTSGVSRCLIPVKKNHAAVYSHIKANWRTVQASGKPW